MFRNVLCTIAFVLAAGVLPARAASISLDVLSPVVAGASFDVAVIATDLFAGRSPTDTLIAFGFDVAVGDPSIVAFTGATEGALFDPLLLSPGTPMVLGFSTSLLGIGPADVSGPLTLAVLHFDALLPGASSLDVAGNAFPDIGLVFAELPYELFNESVTVSAAVPEPTGLALLGAGLMGIAIARRRAIRTRTS